MRLTNFLLSAFLSLGILIFSAGSLRAQNTHGGTAPRTSADKYRAHAERDGLSVGAELLAPKEVSKEFVTNLNRCCLVVRVAVYPNKDELLDVYRDDFTLTVEGSDTPLRPESATIVAAKLQKESGSSSGVTTSSEAGVGYESGTTIDPVTGQPVRVRGVTTSAGAGVGVGSTTPPEVADHDREVMERELSEKSLPSAKISVPISGYLYFAIPKQKKNAKYRLEYRVKDETLALPLP
jgi:hypothetical protein